MTHDAITLTEIAFELSNITDEFERETAPDLWDALDDLATALDMRPL